MAPTTAHRHEERSGRKNAPSLQIPISLCTGIAGNSTVLLHFCLRRTDTISAAHCTVSSRLQYGCSKSLGADQSPEFAPYE
jgi:hypothetical protein